MTVFIRDTWLYREKQKPFTSLVAGFAIHSLAMMFRNVTGSMFIYALVCIYGWYFILTGIWRLRKGMNIDMGILYRMLLFAYIAVSFVMIMRGYMIDYPYQWMNWKGMLNYHLFNPTYVLPYLMPLIAFVNPDDFDFKCIVKWSVVFSMIPVIALLLFGGKLYDASVEWSRGAEVDAEAWTYKFYAQAYMNVVIISFCRRYVDRKVWLINTLGLLCALIINLMSARRGMSATMALLMVIDIYFYLMTLPHIKRLICGVSACVAVVAAMTFFMYGTNFEYIKKRGWNDNRSEVDVALMSQMDDLQKWVGKGLNGRYYHDMHLENDYLDGWRYLSETGYYNMVLKGGYLFVWLYIMVILVPAFRGIFFSRNIFNKALGTLMVVSILQLYPFGHLMFNLYFVVIWMGVRICSTKRVLKRSDREIYEKYFLS